MKLAIFATVQKIYLNVQNANIYFAQNVNQIQKVVVIKFVKKVKRNQNEQTMW
jgi:hypothetical protein